MDTLSVNAAVTLVRKNLDELDPNGSIMYQDENGSTADYGDNESLDGIIMRMLPEAINAVHLAAPSALLEGESAILSGTTPAPNVTVTLDDKVLSVNLADSTFLRLVAFQAKDSSIVVTDIIPEASAEGHKQLNRHIRGRKDRPRLVQLQGQHSGPEFKYYTTDITTETAEATIEQFKYIKEQTYPGTAATNDHTYDISRRLRQNIIDLTTARVMETFGDQRAQAYYQKASSFPSL